jgi:hypothetical protein
LVRLHLLVRFPHLTLGNTKWLCLIHAGHPLSVRISVKMNSLTGRI